MLPFDEKNSDIQTREQPMLARLTRAQLANIGEKNATIQEEDFAFQIFNMAQKKQDDRLTRVYFAPMVLVQGNL